MANERVAPDEVLIRLAEIGFSFARDLRQSIPEKHTALWQAICRGFAKVAGWKTEIFITDHGTYVAGPVRELGTFTIPISESHDRPIYTDNFVVPDFPYPQPPTQTELDAVDTTPYLGGPFEGIVNEAGAAVAVKFDAFDSYLLSPVPDLSIGDEPFTLEMSMEIDKNLFGHLAELAQLSSEDAKTIFEEAARIKPESEAGLVFRISNDGIIQPTRRYSRYRTTVVNDKIVAQWTEESDSIDFPSSDTIKTMVWKAVHVPLPTEAELDSVDVKPFLGRTLTATITGRYPSPVDISGEGGT